MALMAALIAAGAASAAAQSTSDPHQHSAQPELAQPATPPEGQPPPGNEGMMQGMMSQMMGMMGRMSSMQSGGGMAPMSCMSALASVDHVEGWLAFLHTELKITDQQKEAWAAFSESVRKYAEKLRGLGKMAQMKPAKKEGDRFVQVLSGQEALLEARLDHIRAYRKFYEGLSKDQKAVAEELLADHAGMGKADMMRRGGADMMPMGGQ
jgi:hypothetical protein